MADFSNRFSTFLSHSRRLWPDSVDVLVSYRWTDTLTAAESVAFEQVLSNQERGRRERLIRDGDRRDFTAAHGLARWLLSQCADIGPKEWLFHTNEYGKPIIANALGTRRIDFSLSHTKGLVACAVSCGGNVGIDVESVDLTLDQRAIAARFFAPTEVQGLQDYSDNEYRLRFIELWTLKEAYLKAIGAGVVGGLDSIAFSLTGDIDCEVSKLASGSVWQFVLAAPSSETRLSVATSAARSERPRVFVRRPASKCSPALVLRASPGLCCCVL